MSWTSSCIGQAELARGFFFKSISLAFIYCSQHHVQRLMFTHKGMGVGMKQMGKEGEKEEDVFKIIVSSEKVSCSACEGLKPVSMLGIQGLKFSLYSDCRKM